MINFCKYPSEGNHFTQYHAHDSTISKSIVSITQMARCIQRIRNSVPTYNSKWLILSSNSKSQHDHNSVNAFFYRTKVQSKGTKGRGRCLSTRITRQNLTCSNTNNIIERKLNVYSRFEAISKKIS